LWEWLSSNASKLRDLALAGAAGSYASDLLSGLFMPMIMVLGFCLC